MTYTTSSASETHHDQDGNAALLALLASGPRHEEKHVCYERVRVEKGEEVREIVHYHVSPEAGPLRTQRNVPAVSQD